MSQSFDDWLNGRTPLPIPEVTPKSAEQLLAIYGPDRDRMVVETTVRLIYGTVTTPATQIHSTPRR